MPVENSNQFIELLKKSEIASPEIIALWLDRATDQSSPTKIAKSLIKNEFLTQWQAKFLLSGRHKFKFGNYILQERIKSNDIGDYFVAKHEKLNQLVDILFLSKKLSRKLNDRKDVLRLAASAADIVHPGLEHLHTIELHSGRYLVVTDHSKIPSLDEPDNLTRLTADDLLQILIQTSHAVSAAHENGLAHGALTEQDLLYGDEKKINLKNIVASYLVHNLTDDYTGPVSKVDEDAAAITKIGNRLLRRLGESYESADQLKSILENLGQRKVSILDTAQSIAALAGTSDSNLSDSRPSAEPNSTTLAKKENKKTKKQTDAEESQPTNRMLVYGLPVIAVLGLLAIGYFLFTSDWSNLTGSSDQQASSKEHQIKPVKIESSELPSLTPENGGPPNPQLPEEASTNGAKQQEKPQDTSHLDTTMQELLAANDAEDDSGENVEQSDAERDSAQAANKEENKKSADSSDSILNSFENIQSTAKKDEAGENGKNAEVASEAPPKVETALPEYITLPIPNNTAPIKVGILSEASTQLSLVCDTNISKSKSVFQISGSEDSGWEVNYVPNGKDEPQLVANLKVAENNLNFAWAANAAEMPNAPYLKNCVLQIKSGGTTHYVNLRSPVIISNFVFDRTNPQIRIEDIEGLDFLPRNPIVEMHELDEKTFGNIYFNEGRQDLIFARKNPLYVHFRDLPEYRMIFVRLSAEIKKRSWLESELQIQLEPNQKPLVAGQQTLDDAKVYLEQQVANTKARIDYLGKPIDDIRAEQNLTAEQYSDADRNGEKKQLEAFKALTENRSKELREILIQLEPLFEKPLPVSIYFEVDGRRVVLATTVLE